MNLLAIMKTDNHFSSKVFSKSLFYIKLLITNYLEKNRNRKGIWSTTIKNIINNNNSNSFSHLPLSFFYIYIKYSSSKGYSLEKT
jgi:hypothetical protein